MRELRRAAAQQNTEGEEKAAVVQTSVGILLQLLRDEQLTHFVDSMIRLHSGQDALSDAETVAVAEAETEAWLLAEAKTVDQAETLCLQRMALVESDDDSYSEFEADSESEHDTTLEEQYEFMARIQVVWGTLQIVPQDGAVGRCRALAAGHRQQTVLHDLVGSQP